MSETTRRLSTADVVALSIAAAAIATAVIAAHVPRTTLATTPLCWSVILLGRECPGCGLTRSFAAIGRGSFAEANALNPLGPILFAYAVAVIAVRAGKHLFPRFLYWAEIDVALAGGVALSIAVRALLFYFF